MLYLSRKNSTEPFFSSLLFGYAFGFFRCMRCMSCALSSNFPNACLDCLHVNVSRTSISSRSKRSSKSSRSSGSSMRSRSSGSSMSRMLTPSSTSAICTTVTTTMMCFGHDCSYAINIYYFFLISFFIYVSVKYL